MNLPTLALHNLRRRPVRAGLTVIGIAIAIGFALSLLALSRGIQSGARAGLDEIGGDLIVIPKNAASLFSGFIPESALERIRAIPGVERLSGALVAFAPSEAAGNVLTLGWPDGSFLWKKVPLRQGRVPEGGESRVAVLGDAVAAALGKKLNDEIDLFGQSFKIIGIAGYGSRINRGLVLVRLADLQDVSYRPRQVTIAHLAVAHVGVADAADRTELARIRDAIQAPGNAAAASSAEVLGHDRNFILLQALALAAAIIAAVMSALAVIAALALATQERTREIGIFSAIGWSGGRIVESIVIEGVALWAIGCALGVALSFAVAYAAPYIPVIGRLIAFRPSVSLIVPVVGAALVLCMFGALLPAWRAARMLPAEALRR
jgi:putative ABC transport system permease protein